MLTLVIDMRAEHDFLRMPGLRLLCVNALGVVITLSRPYLYVRFPSDVLTGAVIGSFVKKIS